MSSEFVKCHVTTFEEETAFLKREIDIYRKKFGVPLNPKKNYHAHKYEEMLAQKKTSVTCLLRATHAQQREIPEAQELLDRETFRLKFRLPVFGGRSEFEEFLVGDKIFLVVSGDPGTGKSSKLTQFVADFPNFFGQKVFFNKKTKIFRKFKNDLNSK
jgi:hypothetical protein